MVLDTKNLGALGFAILLFTASNVAALNVQTSTDETASTLQAILTPEDPCWAPHVPTYDCIEWTSEPAPPAGSDRVRIDHSVLAADGTMWVAGQAIAAQTQAYLARLDPASGLVEAAYTYEFGNQDSFDRLIVHDGVVYASAHSAPWDLKNHYVAIDAGTGALLWSAEFDRGNDFVTSIGLDATRGILVAGGWSYVWEDHQTSNQQLLAIDAATGERLWHREWGRGTWVSDYTNGFALSADGTVAYLAGLTFHEGVTRGTLNAVDIATGADVFETFVGGTGTPRSLIGVFDVGERLVVPADGYPDEFVYTFDKVGNVVGAVTLPGTTASRYGYSMAADALYLVAAEFDFLQGRFASRVERYDLGTGQLTSGPVLDQVLLASFHAVGDHVYAGGDLMRRETATPLSFPETVEDRVLYAFPADLSTTSWKARADVARNEHTTGLLVALDADRVISLGYTGEAQDIRASLVATRLVPVHDSESVPDASVDCLAKTNGKDKAKCEVDHAGATTKLVVV